MNVIACQKEGKIIFSFPCYFRFHLFFFQELKIKRRNILLQNLMISPAIVIKLLLFLDGIYAFKIELDVNITKLQG